MSGGVKNVNPRIGLSPAPGYNRKESLPERAITLQLTLKGLGPKLLGPSHEMAPRWNSLLISTIAPP